MSDISEGHREKSPHQLTPAQSCSSIGSTISNAVQNPLLQRLPKAKSSMAVLQGVRKEATLTGSRDSREARTFVISGAYTIEILDHEDDAGFLPRWKSIIWKIGPILGLINIAMYWLYMSLRIHFTRNAQKTYDKSYPIAWIFIACEIGTAIPMLMHSVWTVFVLKKRRREKLRLVGHVVPTVDVFITCCGEDVDAILDTARAACNLDYAREAYRVVVLDDGNSAALREAILDLRDEGDTPEEKRRYQRLYYTSRTKLPGVPHHFKAGNLNHGLEYTDKYGASEYVAALDADMIPEPEWLRCLVAHLAMDDKLALACPPQLFYNIPRNDPLNQCLDFFVHVSEPVKDALGVAWCTGSGYVLRRSAIEDIGGFPTGSLAEDVCCSSMLLGKGYKTAYVHEALQCGTVPDSFGSHIKQRTRWVRFLPERILTDKTLGTIQTAIKLNFCLWGELSRGMNLWQRISSLIYTISCFFNIFLVASLFAMPIVLISGGTMIGYANDDQLRWLIRACFATLCVNKIAEYALYIPCGYLVGQSGARSMLWMSPYQTLVIIRAFLLPKWLGGKVAGFQPTGSIKDDIHERDAQRRAPLHRRLKVILFDYMALFHVLYIIFCIVAFATSTAKCQQKETDPVSKVRCHLTHAFWPPLGWLIATVAAWTPVWYAISPPSVPDREELLVRNPYTGVAYPKRTTGTFKKSSSQSLHHVQSILTFGVTAVVFVAAFMV